MTSFCNDFEGGRGRFLKARSRGHFRVYGIDCEKSLGTNGILWKNGNNEVSSSRTRRAQWRGKGVARVRRTGVPGSRVSGLFPGTVRGYQVTPEGR